MVMEDGSQYEGTWYEDSHDGMGTLKYLDGTKRAIWWQNGRMNKDGLYRV